MKKAIYVLYLITMLLLGIATGSFVVRGDFGLAFLSAGLITGMITLYCKDD